jgi:hypothetical protein
MDRYGYGTGIVSTNGGINVYGCISTLKSTTKLCQGLR